MGLHRRKIGFVFLSLLLIVVPTLVNAENAKELFRITTTPTQFLFSDIPINIETRIKRFSPGITVSYRFSSQNEGEITGISGFFGDYLNQNFWNPMYKAYTFSIHTKYWLSEKSTYFIEPELFYRYWWFDNKEVLFNAVRGYRFNGTRTETQQVYGFKLLFGSEIKFNTESKIRPVLEWYCGLGIRYKTYLFKTYDGTVNDQYYTYKEDSGSLIKPSLQLGIKLGAGYYK